MNPARSLFFFQENMLIYTATRYWLAQLCFQNTVFFKISASSLELKIKALVCNSI